MLLTPGRIHIHIINVILWESECRGIVQDESQEKKRTGKRV